MAPPRDDSKRADVAHLAMLVGVAVAVSGGVSYASDEARAGSMRAVVWLGIVYLVLGAGAVAFGLRKGLLARWLVPRGGDLTRGFIAALLLFACAFGTVKLLTLHHSPRAAWMARLYLQLGDPKFLRHHQGWVGLVIFVFATLEELVWRGWANSLLERLTSARTAWISGALLYALAHLPTLWAFSDTSVGKNPLVVLAALGVGLVWGGMARVFGRLGPSIISHALFDWAVLIMFRLWGPSV